jgi:hypothetical protein
MCSDEALIAKMMSVDIAAAGLEIPGDGFPLHENACSEHH